MSAPATLRLDKISVKRGPKILISELSLTLSGPKLLWVVGGNGIGKTSSFWNADLVAGEIKDHGQTLTEKLSTGQIKRLSFAKLLAEKKPIWILDEPLAGLDAAGRNLIAHHLQNHVQAGGLALVASHAPITVEDIPTQRLILK